MADNIAKMTEKEMAVLEREDKKETKTLEHEEALPKNGAGDSLIAALELLDHLEDQKAKLEAREKITRRYKLSERMADGVANFGGSWKFIISFLLFMACWMSLNVIAWISHWDPYPFILLNLMLSTVAALQAPVILMSQNRQSERDRYRDEIDFERDRLDLKVDTLAAKTIREATVRITHMEKQLSRIEKKLDATKKKKRR